MFSDSCSRSFAFVAEKTFTPVNIAPTYLTWVTPGSAQKRSFDAGVGQGRVHLERMRSAFFSSKASVANFSVATKESYTDAEGKKMSSTEWHNVSVFGGLADTVAKHLKKGSKVSIEGRLRTRKWEDKDGVTRYSTEIIANEVLFLDSKPPAAAELGEAADAAA